MRQPEENAHVNNAQKAENKKEETETPVVDMRKKVMRKSYKVTGYRVQVYRRRQLTQRPSESRTDWQSAQNAFPRTAGLCSFLLTKMDLPHGQLPQP